MILRNGANPGGIDLGPARNSFSVGAGLTVNRQKYRVAAQMYARRTSVKADPSLLAMAAAVVRRAIADARAGTLSPNDLRDMTDLYLTAHDLDGGTAVSLDDVREWLRVDAARFLSELDVPETEDSRDLDEAYTVLLNRLQREPGRAA